MARLLVLGCSDLKHRTPGHVPAWFRYDGVLFRVCKKLESRHEFPPDVSVRILSAAFGLLAKETPIPIYDRPMNAARARELRVDVTTALTLAIEASQAREIFLGVGETYRSAIGPLPGHIVVTNPTGGIGEWQAQLKAWLSAGTTSGQLAIDLTVAYGIR